MRHSPSRGNGSAHVWGVYEPDTGSVQYVVACPRTRAAALVDVVWNFDPKSFATDDRSLRQVMNLVREHDLRVEWVLDTHPHADHFMANAQAAEACAAPRAIGEKVRDVAVLWRDAYNMPNAFDVERTFDRLWCDGDTFRIGELPVRVVLSPGHTLASVTYVAGNDAAMVHDTLMHPDVGTSRCDFPGGSAAQLWDTIQTILSLPEETRLFVGHDYGADGRDEPAWEATVAEHKRANVHVRDGTVREDWIRIREERDATLPLPDRMLAALQVNLRGGDLGPPENDGRHYLKMPVNRFKE